MATAAAAAAKGGPKEFTFLWEGKDKAGKIVRGEMRAAGENVVNASLRRQGVIVTKVKKQKLRRRRQRLRKGRRAVHAPDGDHDEGRRAAAAGLRHRRQGRHQSGGGAAADRHQDRSRDRLLARAGVPQVPAVLRRAVLQPGGAPARRPVFWNPCSTGWRSTRKRPSPSSRRSSRRCSTRSSIIVVAFVITAVIMIFVIPAFKRCSPASAPTCRRRRWS